MLRRSLCVVALVSSLLIKISGETNKVEKNEEYKKNCGMFQCPPYEVKEPPFISEKRCYTSHVTYISTEWPATFWGTLVSYKRMRSYFGGSNVGTKQMRMSTPVFLHYGKKDGVMKMKYYVGKSSESHPTPTSPHLKLEVLTTSQCYYVMQFSGYVHFKNWYTDSQLNRIDEDMKRNSKTVKDTIDSDNYVIAVYDGPWKLFNRHNEIMIPIK